MLESYTSELNLSDFQHYKKNTERRNGVTWQHVDLKASCCCVAHPQNMILEKMRVGERDIAVEISSC